MTAEAGLERRVAALEAAIEGLAYPLRSVEMPPLSEAEEQRFREEFAEALKEPIRVLPLPPSPSPVEIRQLLREHVTVVKPGETLVVRVPWTVTPQQLYEYQRVMDGAEGGEIPFRVLVVAGDELGVVQAGDGE